ncbi:UxaA family hydrolase [Solibacillus silvestris]
MRNTFEGYLRNDGSVGTRNYIGLISTVICSSVVTNEIAEQVQNTVPIVHANGCAQLGDDFQTTKNMLAGAAENPNFYAAVLIGLGCETNQVTGLMKSLSANKPFEGFSIQQMAGGTNTINHGVKISREWAAQAEEEKRISLPLSNLKVGIVMEDIDIESIHKMQPIVSDCIKELIQQNATVVWALNKTIEPVSYKLAQQTKDGHLKEKLESLSQGLTRKRWEKSIEYQLEKFSEEEERLALQASQLIEGLEIKSILNYNEKPKSNGLHLIKSSGSLVETLSNFASVGCNITIILSKRSIMTGSSILPSVVVAPESTGIYGSDFLDYLVGNHLQSQTLLEKVIAISSGELTRLEHFNLGEFAIPHVGTTF